MSTTGSTRSGGDPTRTSDTPASKHLQIGPTAFCERNDGRRSKSTEPRAGAPVMLFPTHIYGRGARSVDR
jgi:hypothetical protein